MFQFVKQLKQHMKDQHHQILKNYHCILCIDRNSSFTTQTHLNRHMKTCHSEKKEFKCDLCNKTFSTLKQSKIHHGIEHASIQNVESINFDPVKKMKFERQFNKEAKRYLAKDIARKIQKFNKKNAKRNLKLLKKYNLEIKNPSSTTKSSSALKTQEDGPKKTIEKSNPKLSKQIYNLKKRISIQKKKNKKSVKKDNDDDDSSNNDNENDDSESSKSSSSSSKELQFVYKNPDQYHNFFQCKKCAFGMKS